MITELKKALCFCRLESRWNNLHISEVYNGEASHMGPLVEGVCVWGGGGG